MSNAYGQDQCSSSNGAAGSAALTHLEIAPGIIESIVAIAVEEVPGVASAGSLSVDMGSDTVLTEYNRPDGVELIAEGGQISIDLNIHIYSGYKLVDLADEVRSTVFDALLSQTGIRAKAININVSGIEIEEG